MKEINFNIKTVYLLQGQFGGRVLIPLSEVCQEFFGLSENTARKRAAKDSLPIPCAKTSPSQKSPYMVHIHDLATYIDSTWLNVRKEWKKAQA